MSESRSHDEVRPESADPKEASPSDVPVESAPAGEPPPSVDAMGEKLRESSKGALGPKMLHWDIRFPRLYLLFIFVNLVDLLATRVGMDQKGMVEVNVVARWFLLNLGFASFVLYKLVLTVLVIFLAEKIGNKKPRWAFALLVFGCLAIGVVALWTLIHLFGLVFSQGDNA
jgi:hypothetical protein